MRLVFFSKLRAVYRYRYRIDAQSEPTYAVRFDVVYSQPEAADDRDEVPEKIFAALELEVDLKVVQSGS